jgi:hypothetical protein
MSALSTQIAYRISHIPSTQYPVSNTQAEPTSWSCSGCSTLAVLSNSLRNRYHRCMASLPAIPGRISYRKRCHLFAFPHNLPFLSPPFLSWFTIEQRLPIFSKWSTRRWNQKRPAPTAILGIPSDSGCPRTPSPAPVGVGPVRNTQCPDVRGQMSDVSTQHPYRTSYIAQLQYPVPNLQYPISQRVLR